MSTPAPKSEGDDTDPLQRASRRVTERVAGVLGNPERLVPMSAVGFGWLLLLVGMVTTATPAGVSASDTIPSLVDWVAMLSGGVAAAAIVIPLDVMVLAKILRARARVRGSIATPMRTNAVDPALKATEKDEVAHRKPVVSITLVKAAARRLRRGTSLARIVAVRELVSLADENPFVRADCIGILTTYIRTAQVVNTDDSYVRRVIFEAIHDRLQDPHAAITWCGQELDFSGAIFDGDKVSLFSGANFVLGSRVRFDRATFHGEVGFEGAVFGGATISFDEAEFVGGSLKLGGALFSAGAVSFDRAKIERCTVSFDASFFRGGRLTFDGALFNGATVSFTGALFRGTEVTFDSASFESGAVTFMDASFGAGRVSRDDRPFYGWVEGSGFLPVPDAR